MGEGPPPRLLFDAWVNMHFVSEDAAVDRFLHRPARDGVAAYTVDDLVGLMTPLNITGGILTKVTQHPNPPFISSYNLTDEIVEKSCEEVASAVASHPDHFIGAIMLDPRLGYGAAKHVAIAVDHYGLRAIRVMPALSVLAANDALCYPLYTACCDRGIPVTINVGIPGPLKPAKFQDPMALDEVALALPDLKIVMTHMGDPWIPQVISLLNKHPNLFLMTSGWAPKYIPSAILEFIEKRGPDKVMWASDYPALNFDRSVNEALQLPLSSDRLNRFLGLNALSVFGAPKKSARGTAV